MYTHTVYNIRTLIYTQHNLVPRSQTSNPSQRYYCSVVSLPQPTGDLWSANKHQQVNRRHFTSTRATLAGGHHMSCLKMPVSFPSLQAAFYNVHSLLLYRIILHTDSDSALHKHGVMPYTRGRPIFGGRIERKRDLQSFCHCTCKREGIWQVMLPGVTESGTVFVLTLNDG